MDQYVSFAKVFGFCIILWKCSNCNIIGCNSMYLLVFFFPLTGGVITNNDTYRGAFSHPTKLFGGFLAI